MASEGTSISEWFRGRNVFVTGGTGYMGKVLIYKLLLSCQNLENIFVLIRKKRNVDPQTRLQFIIQQPPFKLMKEKHPERLKKLILIPGDTTCDNLGLSTADKNRLLQEVSVVFHMAANVRFNVLLKEAVKINVEGTRNVLEFAKQMPHLESFIHISTTYCHCTEPVLEERYYPCEIEPEKIIDTVSNMSEEVVNAMTAKLLGAHPNTYAFTKGLSEDLVQRSGLPSGVARPSIVLASLKEPTPGWVDNTNGPTGLMIGAGKGVIRTILCNYDSLLNVIPCDIAINAIIALARKVGREKPEKPIYVNVTNGYENPISWGHAVELGRKHVTTYPFTGVLWYPGGSITMIEIYHWIRVIFLHYLPAYVLDALIVLSGNKPFLIRVQHKVNAGIELMQYYTTKQWDFSNDHMRELQLEMNPADREEFFMDLRAFSWNDYMLQYILGIRQYCLKDDLSTIPRARKVIRRLYYADWIVKISLTMLFVWFVYSWIFPSNEMTTGTFEVNDI